jgi:hypothetical protein
MNQLVKMTTSTSNPGLKYGYKSGLEEKTAEDLLSRGLDCPYEPFKINYNKPETKHTYTPDFQLPNGIIIETKGRLVIDDRKKHVLIKKQHPHLDIRFVFEYAKGKIRKGSKTTYSMWAEKEGFKWAEKTIPQEWIDEFH